MKIKITIGQRSLGDLDVLLTADVTATIGEISRVVALGPSGDGTVAGGVSGAPVRVALRVRYPNDATTYVLDPLSTLAGSGLQSGCWVQVVPVSELTALDVALYQRAAVAEVVSGPQAGMMFDLLPGENIIGRGRDSRIVLTDKKVSRRHAAVVVRSAVTVTDLRSGNGIQLDGIEVQTGTVSDGSRLTVGGSEITIRMLPASISAPVPVVPATFVNFVRPPRVDAFYGAKSVSVPVPPLRGEPSKFPIVAIVAPLVMGVVLFLTSGSALSLIFVALSPIIMIGTYADSRITARRKLRDRVTLFEGTLQALATKIAIDSAAEIDSRLQESPSAADAQTAMVHRNALLWARRPEHQTFLEVRLGLGVQKSRVRIEVPTRNDAEQSYWDRVDAFAAEHATVASVPVLETFDRAGNIGVAGNRWWSDAVMRSLVVQLCGLHSPADLVIACFAEEDNAEDWQWLKWLPHVGSVYSPIGSSHLAGDPAVSTQLIAQLEGVLESRRLAGSSGTTAVRSHLVDDDTIGDLHGTAVHRLPVTPTVVVVVASDQEVDRGRLVRLAEEGPDYGIHLIWHALEVSDIPAACRTFIDVHPDVTASVGFVRSASRLDLAPVETLSMADALIAARRLSPVLDSGAPALDESDLPGAVSYQDLRPENTVSSASDIALLWAKNQSLTARWGVEPPREPATLSAIVGQGVDGVLRLDLRANGPHALVGGTTGSGKSEFLQSWIMSMASEYSPDRLSFLLVDYKGGAAFAECTELPHTVGLVTDLNPHLVRRALTSLRAELRYRETLLNAKAAKDLMALERRADPDAPPSLVIVIDEFAALVGEVPEFVDGIVDVAQRGRSLGLHLIMATQRPAGVIKDNLRANTNLRIALRVADESDSQDVIGVRDAANFNPGTPGRGAAKLGPGKLIHFQTGYLGGHSQTTSAPASIEIENFPFALRDTWTSTTPETTLQSGSRDIETMLESVQTAANTLGLAIPRKPWLDQLENIIDLDTCEPNIHPTDQTVTLGVQDVPEEQRRATFRFDPDLHGSISLIGTSGTGKSCALRTVAASISQHANASAVQIYAIDCSGGALNSLEGLPTVGSVVLVDDHERVQRLMGLLAATAAERAARYSAVSASTLTQYRSIVASTTEPRIIVLVDGIANFRTAYEYRQSDATYQTLLQLISTGRQIGIHFVLTADRPGVIPASMAGNIQLSVVLRMAATSDYGILGVPADVFDDAPAGRGYVDGHEVQLAVLAGSADLVEQTESLSTLAESLRQQNVPETPPIERLATHIERATLPATENGRPVIGVADIGLRPVGIETDGLIVITGPFRSGKTTAMKTVIRAVTGDTSTWNAILISPKMTSELTDTHPWASRCLSASDADTFLRELALSLDPTAPSWPPTGEKGLIVIERSADFEGSPAESAIAAVIKTARKSGIAIVVESDIATGPGAWQIYSELKTARTGIILQPEENDGVSLFRVAFPRASRADFPEGRGYLVEDGRATKLQIALTQEAEYLS